MVDHEHLWSWSESNDYESSFLQEENLFSLLDQSLEVSTGRADHGLAQSNSFWAGYGRAQLINGPTGQKTNWYMVQLGEDQMDNGCPWAS